MKINEEDIARALNQDPVKENPERVEKGVTRTRAQVALIDSVSFFFAQMWVVLAAILAPLFALFAEHLHREAGHPNENGDKNHE